MNVREKKTFYRDVKDKKLFGVLSGCAAYFGGSSLVWRLGYVGLFFFGWMFNPVFSHFVGMVTDMGNVGDVIPDFYIWLIPAYFVVAILAPKAVTPEERLRMKGEAVTPETLAREVAEESCRGTSVQNGGCGDGCLGTSAFFIKFVAFAVLFAIAMFLLFTILGILLLISIPLTHLEMDPFREVLFDAFDSTGSTSVWFVVCWLLVVAVPLYCGVHSLLVKKKKAKRMGLWQRIVWIVLWVVFLLIGIHAGGVIVDALSNRSSEIGMSLNPTYNARKRYDDSLNDGTWMTTEDSTFFADGGWKLIKREACHKQGYTQVGEYYSGDESMRYIEVFNEYGKQIFRAERTETGMEGGTYSLTVMARARGEGAFIYAIADSMLYMREILDYGNNGEDHGWHRVTLTSVKSESGIISYGVTNDPELTGVDFSGKWFSAADFELRKE